MKKIILVPIIAIFVMVSIQSCKKYPNGPAISLISRSERVANTWMVDNYKINGNDWTSLVSGYTETYTKKGAYSYSWGIADGSGTWSFQNRDSEIKLNNCKTKPKVNGT